MATKKKARKFCRLYKYACLSCLKERHKRHYARDGEVCPTCLKKIAIEETQATLFE